MKSALSFILLAVVLPTISISQASAQNTSRVPPNFVESWSFLMGNWSIEGNVRSRSVTGSASFEWAGDQSCYIGKETWQVGPNRRAVQLVLLGGWDASESRIIEQGFSSGGAAATVRYRAPAMGTDVIEGSIRGTNGPGDRWSGQVKVERKGNDEFRLSTTVDGEPLHSLTYVRREVAD